MTSRVPRRWQIGAVRVTRVVEQITSAIGRYVLPDATPERLASIPWLADHHVEEGRPVFNIQAFLVEVEDLKILVDTCVGNDKERAFDEWHRMQTDFLERLATIGAAARDVDVVLCTHLHVDHVGWNTVLVDGRWQPTFENARYLFSKDEWRYWDAGANDPDDVIGDSVRPIVESGLAELIEPPFRLTPEIALVATPGHTPGHVSVRIESAGEVATITGDLIHHPSQMAFPNWRVRPDIEPERALATRQDFLARAAEDASLVIGSHFSGATSGRVVEEGDAYRFDEDSLPEGQPRPPE